MNSEENDSQRNVTETCQNPWGYLIGLDFDLRGQEQDINEQGYRRKGLSLYKTWRLNAGFPSSQKYFSFLRCKVLVWCVGPLWDVEFLLQLEE